MCLRYDCLGVHKVMCSWKILLSLTSAIILMVHIIIVFVFVKRYSTYQNEDYRDFVSSSIVKEVEVFMSNRLNLMNTIKIMGKSGYLDDVNYICNFESIFLSNFQVDEDLCSLWIFHLNDTGDPCGTKFFTTERSTNFLVSRLEILESNTTTSSSETRIRNLPVVDNDFADYQEVFSSGKTSYDLLSLLDRHQSCQTTSNVDCIVDNLDTSKIRCTLCSSDLLVHLEVSMTRLETSFSTYVDHSFIITKSSDNGDGESTIFSSQQSGSQKSGYTRSIPLVGWTLTIYDSDGESDRYRRIHVIIYTSLSLLIFFILFCLNCHCLNWICSFLCISCQNMKRRNREEQTVVEVSHAVANLDFSSPRITELLLLPNEPSNVKRSKCRFMCCLICWCCEIVHVLCCINESILRRTKRKKKGDFTTKLALQKIIRNVMTYKDYLPTNLRRTISTQSFESIEEETMSWTTTTSTSGGSSGTASPTSYLKKTIKKKKKKSSSSFMRQGPSLPDLPGRPNSKQSSPASPIKTRNVSKSSGSVMLIDLKNIDIVFATIKSENLLNDYFAMYFDTIVPLIQRSGGSIHSISTHEIVSSWNLVTRKVDHCRYVAEASVRVRESFINTLAPLWAEKNFPVCEISIAIFSSESIFTGYLGSTNRDKNRVERIKSPLQRIVSRRFSKGSKNLKKYFKDNNNNNNDTDKNNQKNRKIKKDAASDKGFVRGVMGFAIIGNTLKILRKMIELNSFYGTKILMDGKLRHSLRFISVNQCVDVVINSGKSYFELHDMKVPNPKMEWNYVLEELEKKNTNFDLINKAWKAYEDGDYQKSKLLLSDQIEKNGIDSSARRLLRNVEKILKGGMSNSVSQMKKKLKE